MNLSESFKNRAKKLAGLSSKRQLDETVIPETWAKLDFIVDALGHEGTLDALIRFMDDSSVNQALDGIAKDHDIPLNPQVPTQNPATDNLGFGLNENK